MKREGNSNSNDMEEAARNEMMQNLFGEQSEDEEEDSEDDPEIDSEHERAANQSDYHSEEGEGEAENHDEQQIEVENEAELEGEGENEGIGEVEIESEAEPDHEEIQEPEAEAGHVESEGERVSEGERDSEGEREEEEGEREVSERRMESEEKEEAESEDEGYGQRVVTSKRRDVVESGSEESEGNYYSHDHYNEADEDNEEEGAEHNRKTRLSEDKEEKVVRDVFGDSDEDEPSPYRAPQNETHHESPRSPMEEEGSYDKIQPEDIVPDEDAPYGSEDENIEQKAKEKPVGPPLELDVPVVYPPGRTDRMNVIKVSNIMGIESKPFDPKTYVEEDVFVTDETGAKKRIRLEDNIVRWRSVKNRNGTISYESNARFVKWKDGSLQLLIGNEVLDISVHESTHDQSHLFLRHGKGTLQSQGRLLRKMRFMPSSLSSKSHRLLTALVDSRHKKVYKVKNWITETDPEREKEERERAEGLQIRAQAQQQRKRQNVNMKYQHLPSRKQREISPNWLEDGDEEEDQDYYNSRRGSSRNRFEDELEAEAHGRRRPMSAKKPGMNKSGSHKHSASRPAKRRLEDEYEDESEYETDGDDLDGSPPPRERREDDFLDDEEEYQDSEEEAAGPSDEEEEEYEEVPKKKNEKEAGRGGGGGGVGVGQKRKGVPSDDEEDESPPKKAAPAHRRKAIVYDSDED